VCWPYCSARSCGFVVPTWRSGRSTGARKRKKKRYNHSYPLPAEYLYTVVRPQWRGRRGREEKRESLLFFFSSLHWALLEGKKRREKASLTTLPFGSASATCLTSSEGGESKREKKKKGFWVWLGGVGDNEERGRMPGFRGGHRPQHGGGPIRGSAAGWRRGRGEGEGKKKNATPPASRSIRRAG